MLNAWLRGWLLLVVGLWLNMSWADDSEIKSIDTVVVSTHYTPPWSYQNCTGAEIDVIRLAFAEVGLNIDCSFSSYARLVKQFIHKRSQFASPVVKVEGDQVGAIYSDNFVPYVDVVASFEPESIQIDDLIAKKTVAYQKARMYLGKKYAQATAMAPYYRELPGREEQIHMLAMGRVDHVVGEKNILIALAKSLYPEKTLHVNLVLKRWDIRAGSHDLGLMRLFNKGLQQVRDKGLIEQTFARYSVVQ